jgi:hypothetical protein
MHAILPPACRLPGLLLTGLLSLALPAAGAAPTADAPAVPTAPGFVAGDAKPAGDGPFVKAEGGWMTPYEETIPGSDVTFRMIPVPGGTFRIGSGDGEEGRTADEGPAFEVRVEPFWIGQHEVTWAEYKRYMATCDVFIAMQSAGIRPVTEANVADAVPPPSSRPSLCSSPCSEPCSAPPSFASLRHAFMGHLRVRACVRARARVCVRAHARTRARASAQACL